MEDFIQYNNDNSVNVPFRRVAEWYIVNHPLLKNVRLKCQTRRETSGLIKSDIINVNRVEGAVDFIEWNTKKGDIKSTNRIDDIITLTSKGEEYVKQIEAKEKKDKLCWSWVMYCSGEGNSCERECGGIGSCKEACANYSLQNNKKNYRDMHLCKLRVISESKLSWLSKEKPLKIKIVGSHLPTNVLISHNPSVSRLNLSRQVRDHIIVSRRSDHRTANSVKLKLLAPFNGAEENELKEALKNQRQICNNDKLRSYLMRDDRRLKENSGPWTILHYLVMDVLKLKGFVLYYQQPDFSQPEDEKQFYQLTLSNEFWLRNGKNFGQKCIGMDSKHDLNNDRAPVLVFVAENNSGSGTPLAFGISNKENQWTIKLSIKAIKKNIQCDQNGCEHKWSYIDLPNGKGFKRIRECNSSNWNPLVMIDKHRPSKIAIDNNLHGAILCWYPLALAFKIIGRSRTEDEAKELGLLYQDFVNSLKLSENVKQKLITDLNRNWLCDEWRLSFIDAGRILPNFESIMTTNNFTERLNRTIEANYSGVQTVVNFVERLYGVKLKRENITENTGKLQFEAGLATLFDMKSIEEENCSKKLSSDKLRRLNYGRLYFLLEFVEPSNHNDYFYVRKSDNVQTLESPFDGKSIKLDEEAINNLNPLFKKLEQKHLDKASHREGYYLTNILTGECICYDYIWNGPFRDVCKHVHAARLYHNANQYLEKECFFRQIKEDFVTYFKNKERVIPAENKNRLIYEGDTDEAYNEIIRLYYLQGGSIFLPRDNISGRNSDPFRPPELKYNTPNKGAPPKAIAKPRKPSRILQTLQLNSHNETNSFALEKRNTKRARKDLRNTKSTAERHSSNIKNINNYDSSDNISSTFYTNHYSDQQPIYNENITSTLPPVSSPCVPGPQRTIENTTYMNSINPSQSEILSFDIPGYKIIIIPTFSQQDNTCLNYSSSDNTNIQFTQF
ncbi:hypothetical protein RhiirA5_468619 [Rhizophagus irregularis]|uniref:SWIM-type domain-containing protein n=1 Tax=Rhizophagus irregularis TaxID=588596 RepID=A0A2N0NRT2_9GLOM|nr:hypothetical protein RhiirA5_468619 [Rhizophagus irregularis]